ncbi:MAG: 16S rRNA (guanine(527)-N(7))-methyltransferase RsmG [Candidatus Eremiobacteraeota bacterium]|nr:16S rRNA (guanine(527)-N(7))-methyltransferase RsmG [Candidatus Eremiobacteraeota bacterium]
MQRIKNIFQEKLSCLDISLPDSTLSNLFNYFAMLTRENKKINLIGPMEDERIIDYLFMDSLSFLEHFHIESNHKIVDLGTGAGFPGLVIKIARPDIHITLIDSSQKKINFVKKVCCSLSIDEITFFSGRVEEAGRSPEYREKYDFVLSRAVADLPVLVEFCAPLLKKGGKLVAWKGKKHVKEIKRLGKAYLLVGLDAPDIKINRSLGEDWSSWLVSFSKVMETPERFPRSYQAIKRKSIELLNSKVY